MQAYEYVSSSNVGLACVVCWLQLWASGSARDVTAILQTLRHPEFKKNNTFAFQRTSSDVTL